MIVGVPLFAVIYRLIMEFTTWLLKRKKLSNDIKEYDGLERIDEMEQTYIKK